MYVLLAKFDPEDEFDYLMTIHPDEWPPNAIQLIVDYYREDGLEVRVIETGDA